MNNTILAIDIGTTSISTVVAQNDTNDKINILGVSIDASKGTNKGLVTNLEVASKAVENAINCVKNGLNCKIDSIYVAISSAYTKGILSSGSVNIQNGLITHNEISQVLKVALSNVMIADEYSVIHVVPIYFKVDETQLIDNPLNMNGQKLEVYVYIVTAKQSALNNIRSVFKSSNLEITNFVLSSYASAISVLDEEQKKLGSVVLDVGGSTTDIIYYKGNSILFNDFLPVGSTNITNDLTRMFNTPTASAETIKIKYANLLYVDELNDYSGQNDIKKIETPIIGDESNANNIAMDAIQMIIYARVEEILILAREKIKKSGAMDGLNAEITITGGITFIRGIKELAQKVFENHPVKIAKPANIKNGIYNFEDPTLATIVGVLLYGLDKKSNLELDSNKTLKHKPIKRDVLNLETIELNTNIEQEEKLPQLTIKDKGGNIISRMFKKMGDMF